MKRGNYGAGASYDRFSRKRFEKGETSADHIVVYAKEGYEVNGRTRNAGGQKVSSEEDERVGRVRGHQKGRKVVKEEAEAREDIACPS